MDELILNLYVCDQDHLHLVASDGNGLNTDALLGPADSHPDLKSACRDDRGRFAPCGSGGLGAAGRRIVQAERMRKAREMVAAIKSGPRPVPHDKIRKLADHLGTMTNAQLTSLRNEHNLKGGRVKDQLKQKLVDHLAGKPGAGKHATDHVPVGTFGEPKNLQWDRHQHQGVLKEAIARYIGPHGTREQLAACVGAIDGSNIVVSRNPFYSNRMDVTFSGSIKVKNPETGVMEEKHFSANRTMRIENGKKRIHNNIFEGEGAGVSMFGRQVENATKHGFDQIDTHAAGMGDGVPGVHSRGTFNGYYTWPRFGYNDTVPSSVYAKLPAGMKAKVDKHGGKVSGLMGDKKSRDWWMGHGSSLVDSKFDLTKGSYSQRTLNAYLHERNILK